MKATGNFEAARNVDPMVALSDDTRAHIDHWLAKFPPDRKRSAVLQGLHAAQEQNGGWLTDELIAAVAKYLDLPPVWAYEVASFYSMFETAAGRPQQRRLLHQHQLLAQRRRGPGAHAEKKLGCKLGESTADGRVYLKREEECVAACCGAPVIVINGHYHEKLDADEGRRAARRIEVRKAARWHTTHPTPPKATVPSAPRRRSTRSSTRRCISTSRGRTRTTSRPAATARCARSSKRRSRRPT